MTALCERRHNDRMAIRTTIDIPEPLHEELRARAARQRTSIRALIVGAIEQAYAGDRERTPVTGPLVVGKGALGPAFPVDENPHDLVFS